MMRRGQSPREPPYSSDLWLWSTPEEASSTSSFLVRVNDRNMAKVELMKIRIRLTTTTGPNAGSAPADHCRQEPAR